MSVIAERIARPYGLVLDINSTLTLSTLNDVPGEDYVRNLDIADIDFATIHVYPDSWGVPPSYYTWVNDNFIGDRAALAAAHGKPLMLEVCLLPTTDNTGLLYLHPIIILSSLLPSSYLHPTSILPSSYLYSVFNLPLI